ncbi:hypothetical protein FA13DRAFT_1360562 [Coprinellus micaceus]|uniref:Uncharacterized protein n=1 Tax=Coprinellus micaceus TaxID=71717 RepID=A0A4Y7TN52_COPMI|nr:hypothetical protein FA13DRAFT_1360562 [Coprinellus micaceus]
MLPYWAHFCILWTRLSPSPLSQSWLGCTETKIHRILWSDSIFFSPPFIVLRHLIVVLLHMIISLPLLPPLLSIDPHPPIPRPVCIHCSWLSTFYFRLRPRCMYPGDPPLQSLSFPFVYHYHYFTRIFYKLLIFNTDPRALLPPWILLPLLLTLPP